MGLDFVVFVAMLGIAVLPQFRPASVNKNYQFAVLSLYVCWQWFLMELKPTRSVDDNSSMHIYICWRDDGT